MGVDPGGVAAGDDSAGTRIDVTATVAVTSGAVVMVTIMVAVTVGDKLIELGRAWTTLVLEAGVG
jgi:predicted RecA/RadA family phage recombinase